MSYNHFLDIFGLVNSVLIKNILFLLVKYFWFGSVIVKFGLGKIQFPTNEKKLPSSWHKNLLDNDVSKVFKVVQ